MRCCQARRVGNGARRGTCGGVPVALFLVCSVLALPMAAAGERLDVLVLGLGDDIPALVDRSGLEAALLEGAQRAGTVRDERGLSLTMALSLLGCVSLDESCARELAGLFETRAVLVPEVQRTGSVLSMRLRWVSVAPGGSPGFDVLIPLDRPALASELPGRMRSWLSGLSVLEVRSSRLGDTVSVDGRPIGAAPVVVIDVQPGSRLVEVRREGDHGRRAVDVARAENVVVRFTEQDIRRQGWLNGRRAGALSLWVGAAAAGAGAGLLATELRTTEEAFERERVERQADALARQGRRQAVGVNALVGVAGVAAVAGTVLLLRPGPEARRQRSGVAWRLLPTAGGAGAVMQLEWAR